MKKKLIFPLTILMILLFVGYFYLTDEYKSEKNVSSSLKSSDSVKVVKKNTYYLFDGEGEENAIIFYPGAKVEYTSYAPLMMEIASQGVDCFLMKFPYNIAFFRMNAGDDVLKNYSYSHWYLAGHSLGGVVGSSYVNKHSDTFDGIIFLASYSMGSMDENIRILSINGDHDGVLNMKSYNKSKKQWKDYDEFIIKGGNHAGFGNYGPQKKDKKATISNQKQQEITADKIIEFVSKA